MFSRIHIMGASGSGTTTLGQALAEKLPHVHLDSDDYFWEHKFTKQSDKTQRLAAIKRDLDYAGPWILSGAVCGWGDELRAYFDLVIFLWIPPELRLERLKAREYERYGKESLPGGSKFTDVQVFWNGPLYMIRQVWRSEAEHCMRNGCLSWAVRYCG